MNYTEDELAEAMRRNPDLKIAGQASGRIERLSGQVPVPATLPVVPRQSEAIHQVKVIKLLRENGWLVHAERHAWTKKGYRTPIQGDAGWFDIAAIHPIKHEVLLIELKSDGGKLSSFQEKWVLAANQCIGVKVMILRPEDMEKFEEVVK